jgi:hypothetical protein
MPQKRGDTVYESVILRLNRSDPILHDIYKAVLTYYPNDVISILKTRFKSKLFEPSDKTMRLVPRTKPEVELYNQNDFYRLSKRMLFQKRSLYDLFKTGEYGGNENDRLSGSFEIPYIRADCVWFFDKVKKNYPNQGCCFQDCYRVIHEVKTGKLDLKDIHEKYKEYGLCAFGGFSFGKFGQSMGMSSQLWIWSYNKEIERELNESPTKSNLLKVLPLEWLDLVLLRCGVM